MADATRKIKAGRDYIEHVEGDFYSGASDNAQQTIHVQNFAEGITPDSPKEDVVKLLGMVKQELATLELPDEVKEETAHEIEGAELQMNKAEPNKEKTAKKLQSATEVLKEAGTLGAKAVEVGNMLGKAILWCGVQWTLWKYGV